MSSGPIGGEELHGFTTLPLLQGGKSGVTLIRAFGLVDFTWEKHFGGEFELLVLPAIARSAGSRAVDRPVKSTRITELDFCAQTR